MGTISMVITASSDLVLFFDIFQFDAFVGELLNVFIRIRLDFSDTSGAADIDPFAFDIGV